MPANTITVCLNEPIGTINPNLYGHFAEHLGACVDDGIWVGENSAIPNTAGIRSDVIEALRRIHPPILRWPGGCFADDYHWRDGVGPRKDRPRTVNLWWGHTIECNHFGTHEFLNFCRLIGAQPYLAGNLGSGTVREMRDWVEYCNFPADSSLARLRGANGSPHPFNVKYWGVGNEQWGCGGNFCPEDYAAEYKRFSTYLRDFGDTKLFLIACGPDTGGKPDLHIDWTKRFFKKLGGYSRIHGFAAHYYCGTAGTATEYSTDQWYELLHKATRMRDVIDTHRALMDEYDPQRKIALLVDEWGTWHPPTPGRNPAHLWQQNTLRDALAAAITLDIFNTRADKIAMANIAQTANVLQALLLTQGEKMILTPTYHVYDLYQSHQGGQSLRIDIETPQVKFVASDQRQQMPAISGSCSRKRNRLTLSIVNAHASLPQDVTINLRGGSCRRASARVLSDDDVHAHNTFEEPNLLTPRDESVDADGDTWHHTFPPASITAIEVELS